MNKAVQVILENGQVFTFQLSEKEALQILDAWASGELEEKCKYFTSKNVKTLSDGGNWGIKTAQIVLMNIGIPAQPTGPSQNQGAYLSGYSPSRRN